MKRETGCHQRVSLENKDLIVIPQEQALRTNWYKNKTDKTNGSAKCRLSGISMLGVNMSWQYFTSICVKVLVSQYLQNCIVIGTLC